MSDLHRRNCGGCFRPTRTQPTRDSIQDKEEEDKHQVSVEEHL
jgi:hypothetical protein